MVKKKNQKFPKLFGPNLGQAKSAEISFSFTMGVGVG